MFDIYGLKHILYSYSRVCLMRFTCVSHIVCTIMSFPISFLSQIDLLEWGAIIIIFIVIIIIFIILFSIFCLVRF